MNASPTPRTLRRTLALAGLLALPAALLAENPPLWWGDRPDGVAVRQGYHIEWQRTAETGGPGEMILSWSDTRFGMRDLFAQKLDASQPGAPALWSTDSPVHGSVDALIVSDAVIRQEDPVLITDGSGGAIVSWIDFRDDLAGDIYVNRLVDGPNGVGELAWGENGVLLCDECANGSENMSKSHCIDGAGGSWIAWSDRRGSNWDIYISRVLHDGSIDPNFGVNGVAVVDAVGDQRDMSMEHDGQGGAYLAWVDKRNAADDNIYIEHILADGTFVNGGNGLAVTTAPGRQHSVRVTWDGGTGAWVAWVDQRNDNAGDLYVQHYGSDLTPSLPGDGTPVAAQPQSAEKNPRLSWAGTGGTLLMWEDNRNDPGNTQADVYVQRISVGNLQQWGAGGVPATLAAGNQEQARVIGDGTGGGYVVWQDFRNETWSSIYAQRLDTDGNRLWGVDGSVVVDRADIGSDAVAPSLRLDGEGGLFVAWGDLSRGSLGIFTQHLDDQGQRSYAVEGHDSAWGIAGSCSTVRNVALEDGVLVFWIDPRNSGGPHIYMQHLAAGSGAPQLAPNGVPVDLGLEGGQINYSAIPDGEGGAFVLIEAGSDRAQQAFLTRIAADGSMIWSASQPVTPGFDTSSGLEYQERTRLVRAGDRVVVAWSGVDTDYSDFFAEVGLQAFDLDGNALWGDDGLRVTNTPAIHEKLDDLVAGPAGSVYVLWDSGNWQDTDVLAQRVAPDGSLLWEPAGLVFAGGAGKQESARATASAGGSLIGVWLDFTAEISDSDLIARAVDSAGNPLWTANIDLRSGSQKTPVIHSDGQGGAFIGYTDFSNGVDDDVFVQHVLADGSLAWSGEDSAIYAGPGTQEDVAATVVPRGESWLGYTVAVAAQEQVGDTTGYKDLWVASLHVSPADGSIAAEDYAGTVFPFFHSQREPVMNYDLADGVYLSWIDMRASGKEDIKDIYTLRVAEVDTRVEPQSPLARGFQLGQNYPNPFNPETRIDFQLLRAGHVRLDVHNLRGQLVRTLVDGPLGAGTHGLSFDARDEAGRPLASGVYIYRLQADGHEDSRKMLLVR
jgi:hypothetical protein